MFGLISAVGKTFKALGSVATKIPAAIKGVGATVFTAGAASGAGSMASGGFGGILQGLTGGGVLGNILTGALKTAIPGALIGGAVGAMTGAGFGKGALMGGLGGAAVGGLSGAMGGGLFSSAGLVPGETPTGMAPTGATAATPQAPAVAAGPGLQTAAAAPAAQGGGRGGFMDFLGSEVGGNLIGGIGEGMMRREELQAIEDERQRERDFTRAERQRVTDSYNVGDAAFAGYSPASPVAKAAVASPPGRFRYVYDRSTRNVERVSG